MSCCTETQTKWTKSGSKSKPKPSVQKSLKKENQTGCNFADLEGIPMAPYLRVSYSVFPQFGASPKGVRGRGVDKWFAEQKVKLSHRLPLLEQNDLIMHKMSYPTFVIYNLMQEGHSEPAEELKQILKKELREMSRGKYRDAGDKAYPYGHIFVPLVSKPPDIVDHLVDHLKLMEDEKLNGHFEAITLMRKELGEKFLRSKDFWLAKHFFLSALKSSQRLFVAPLRSTSSEVDEETKSRAARIQAEIHCLLAYMARHNIDNLEKALESAVRHLNYCRILSKDKTWWQVSPGNILIRIKSPIELHGLRNDQMIIDGSSMNLYTLATLLEHELLMSLANQSLQRHKMKHGLQQDFHGPHQWADKALKLAIEVGHPGALASALVKFGEVLRHSGKYKEALEYLEYLKDHSGLTGDYITECIAYHNFALCHISLGNNLLGLEFLVQQWELSKAKGYLDLEADAVQELGFICLLEGQGWDSEFCYSFANQRVRYLEKINYHNQSSSTTGSGGNNNSLFYGDKSAACTCEEERKKNLFKSHSQIAQSIAKNCDLFWAFSGIASGLTFTPRMTGLIRADDIELVDAMNDWKRSRYCLPFVPTPNYEPDLIKNDIEGESSITEIDKFYAASSGTTTTEDAEDDESVSLEKTVRKHEHGGSTSNNTTQHLTESNDTTTTETSNKTKFETDGKDESQLISETSTSEETKLQTEVTQPPASASVSVNKSDLETKKGGAGFPSTSSKGANGNKSDTTTTTTSKTNKDSKSKKSSRSKSKSRQSSGRSKFVFHHQISQVEDSSQEYYDNGNENVKSSCSSISIKEEHIAYEDDYEYQSDINALMEVRRYHKIIEAVNLNELHRHRLRLISAGRGSLRRPFSIAPRPSTRSLSSYHMKLKPFILSQVFINALNNKKEPPLQVSDRI